MPSSPDSDSQGLYQLSQQLRLNGRPAEAEQALKQAIAADPAFTLPYISLAYLHHYQGDRRAATAALGALLSQTPDNLLLQKQVASLLLDFGYTDEALDHYRGMTSRHPGDAGLQFALGKTLQTLGQRVAAAGAFRRALDINADLGAAWLLLAQAQIAASGSAAEPYLAALRDPRLSKDTRICLHFGLGKILDDLDRYEQAFENFRLGNSLWHEDHDFDRHAFADMVTALKRCFAGRQLPAGAPSADIPQPVFVIGMLRSGTTLVERIIARHPQAFGLGETELADILADKTTVPTGQPYPESVALLSAADGLELASQYRMQWPVTAMHAARVVDKNPLNFLHVGLLASLFPDAQFVHCVRDPLDTCLSIYFQHFAHARNSYAYDLEDIAFVYRQYEDLMTLWRSVLPAERLRDVHYARLVNRPDEEIPELIKWLNLEWDPACLSPHLHTDDIRTASVWQAREPIHTGALGRARHYWEHLSDLRRDLGETGEKVAH
jgi:tetratricopeptide (TPR) repeat protein